MEISDVAEMKALEDENCRLKRIVADQALNIDVLKMAASGKQSEIKRLRMNRNLTGWDFPEG